MTSSSKKTVTQSETQSETLSRNHSRSSQGERSYRRYGSRFKARRRAVDILFEAEFRDIDPVDISEERVKLSADPENNVKPVAEYTQHIVMGVAENLDAIDHAIAMHLSSDWRLERLPAVDRAVLRVSAWEILFNDSVDNKVAVVEGIELAAQYSHDRAPGYVNAVLDGVTREADRRLADRVAMQAEGIEAHSGEDMPEGLDKLLRGVRQEDEYDEILLRNLRNLDQELGR